jgi:hypothetical protein
MNIKDVMVDARLRGVIIRNSKIPHLKFSDFPISCLKLTKLVLRDSPEPAYSSGTKIRYFKTRREVTRAEIELCGSARMTNLGRDF